MFCFVFSSVFFVAVVSVLTTTTAEYKEGSPLFEALGRLTARATEPFATAIKVGASGIQRTCISPPLKGSDDVHAGLTEAEQKLAEVVPMW